MTEVDNGMTPRWYMPEVDVQITTTTPLLRNSRARQYTKQSHATRIIPALLLFAVLLLTRMGVLSTFCGSFRGVVPAPVRENSYACGVE